MGRSRLRTFVTRLALAVALVLAVAAALASRERKAMAFVVPARAGAEEWPTADGVLYFSTPASRVVALDAETGRPCPDFGEGGEVDLGAGVDRIAVGLVLARRRDLAPHAAGLLQMLTRDNPFTSERARRELAWAPRVRPAGGKAEAFAWWKENRVWTA